MDDCTTDCPICLEDFSKDIIPRSLPCNSQHIICTDCLIRFGNISENRGNKFKCPLCRYKISWPENGIDGFEKVSIKDLFFQLFRKELFMERERLKTDEQEENRFLDSMIKRLHREIELNKEKYKKKLDLHYKSKKMDLNLLENDLNSILESNLSSSSSSPRNIDLDKLKTHLNQRFSNITKITCSIKKKNIDMEFIDINISDSFTPINTYSITIDAKPIIVRGKRWFYLLNSNKIVKLTVDKSVEIRNIYNISSISASSERILYALTYDNNHVCPYQWKDEQVVGEETEEGGKEEDERETSKDYIDELEFFSPINKPNHRFVDEKTACFIVDCDLILYDTNYHILIRKSNFFYEPPLAYRITQKGILIIVLNKYNIQICKLSELIKHDNFHGEKLNLRKISKFITIKYLLGQLKKCYRMITTGQYIYLISPDMKHSKVFRHENLSINGKLKDFFVYDNSFHLCFLEETDDHKYNFFVHVYK